MFKLKSCGLFYILIQSVFLILSNLRPIRAQSPYDSNGYRQDFEDFFWTNPHKTGRDDKHIKDSLTIVEGVSYGVIAVLIISFFAFIFCICCPVCILAKLLTKHQRRNGFGLTRGRRNCQTTTNLTATHTNNLPVIAIQNQQRSNPYPTQQSVTIVPLIPQITSATNFQPLQAPTNINIATSSYINDPPPPYPGTNYQQQFSEDPNQRQPAYNPFYNGSSQQGLNSTQISNPPYPTK